MAGGPLLCVTAAVRRVLLIDKYRLYAVRASFDLWYNYRITKSQDYLESLYKERDATIEKLKEATKYNSTEQLLKKYGSPRPSLSGEPGNEKKSKSPGSGKRKQDGDRIFMAPPPTANIQRPPSQQQLPPPQQASPIPPGPPPSNQRPTGPTAPSPTAEFAPNAFDSGPQYASAPSYGEAHWYDRILDALLGEDETQAKNRFALICQRCRLVNGQAPPGARTLEDVGRWRCHGCGAMNGVESEVEKLAEAVEKSAKVPAPKVDVLAEDEDSVGAETPFEEELDEDEEEGEDDDAQKAGETSSAHSAQSKAKKGS